MTFLVSGLWARSFASRLDVTGSISLGHEVATVKEMNLGVYFQRGNSGETFAGS
jgi:hypothetical protein